MARDPMQWARSAAVVIGFVTGLIALVRLLISGWSAVPTVLAGAGAAYLILLAGIGVVSLINPDLLTGPIAGDYRVTRPEALFGFTLAALWIWFFGIDRDELAVVGVLGSLLVFPDAVRYYRQSRRTRPAQEKVCPDCAEQVKAAAKVCRFCGHRFDNSVNIG